MARWSAHGAGCDVDLLGGSRPMTWCNCSVMLCGGLDYAVCRAGLSITSLGSGRRASRAVGSGGVSRAMEASER
jgi:hypothetical protein